MYIYSRQTIVDPVLKQRGAKYGAPPCPIDLNIRHRPELSQCRGWD